MSWLSRLLGADGDSVDQNVVEDLLSFEEENDMLLPNNLTAEDIARFEAAGWIVDLRTGQLIPEAEAVIDEKNARPGLGPEPDAAWTPVSEPDLMEADLVALRSGLVRPFAYMDAATAEAIEDEAIGLEFSTQPYNW